MKPNDGLASPPTASVQARLATKVLVQMSVGVVLS